MTERGTWPEPRTVWRMHTLVDAIGRPREGLDIIVTVATTARVVTEAIERAAADHGIVLERVQEESS